MDLGADRSPDRVDTAGRVVIERFHIPGMTTNLRHFSFPAQNETIAPQGSHE